MSQPAGFVWKGISFSWSAHRAAFHGGTIFNGQLVVLFVRARGLVTWESWCEFNNWHTVTRVMPTRHDALQGSALELQEFFGKISGDVKKLLDRSADPFHDHLDHCKQCAEQPFDLCESGARLLTQTVGAK